MSEAPSVAGVGAWGWSLGLGWGFVGTLGRKRSGSFLSPMTTQGRSQKPRCPQRSQFPQRPQFV